MAKEATLRPGFCLDVNFKSHSAPVRHVTYNDRLSQFFSADDKCLKTWTRDKESGGVTMGYDVVFPNSQVARMHPTHRHPHTPSHNLMHARMLPTYRHPHTPSHNLTHARMLPTYTHPNTPSHMHACTQPIATLAHPHTCTQAPNL